MRLLPTLLLVSVVGGAWQIHQKPELLPWLRPAPPAEQVAAEEAARHYGHGADTLLLFGTKTCGYCSQARAYFAEHHIAYVDYRIDDDPQAMALFQQLGGGDGVPYLVLGEKRMSGFNPEYFEQNWRAGRS